MANPDPFFSSLPGLFPNSWPQIPDREQTRRRRRQSSIPSLPDDASEQPVHDLEQINLEHLEAKDRNSLPEEYTYSRSGDGTMPHRVLHLRSMSSGTGSGPLESYDGTDAGSSEARPYTGNNSSAGELFNQKHDQSKTTNGYHSPLQSLQSHTLTIEDSNVVDWDGPSDPENPMNWSTSKKNIAVAMASIITFVT